MVNTRSMAKKKKLIRLMENFSEDIIMEIMLRLPVKSTLRFRCVCMSWYKLLTSSFARVKLNHDSLILTTNGYDYKHIYSIDNSSLPVKIKTLPYGEIHVFGTCNGLVCASFGFGLYIWNPCTSEYRIILTIQNGCSFDWDLHRTGYGFCYDSKTPDYKVILFYNELHKRVSKVRVYTLGSNSWRTLPRTIPYCIDEKVRRQRLPGVFLNKALHWLVDSVDENEKTSRVLLSFDIEDERFQEISQPDAGWEKFDYKFVGVVKGCLCMLCSVSKVGFEIWVMNDYGVKASWAKMLQIDEVTKPFNYLRSIVDLRNGEILLDDEESNSFILYDPKQKTVRFPPTRLQDKKFATLENNRRNIFVYVESLVSVNSGKYVGGKQEKSDYLKAIEGVR